MLRKVHKELAEPPIQPWSYLCSLFSWKRWLLCRSSILFVPINNTTMEKTNNIAISLSDVKKSFGDNVVLDGITVDVCKGENFVVLGRSGSGKSVLIKIIIGLLQPDAGTVNVLGQEVPALDR